MRFADPGLVRGLVIGALKEALAEKSRRCADTNARAAIFALALGNGPETRAGAGKLEPGALAGRAGRLRIPGEPRLRRRRAVPMRGRISRRRRGNPSRPSARRGRKFTNLHHRTDPATAW